MPKFEKIFRILTFILLPLLLIGFIFLFIQFRKINTFLSKLDTQSFLSNNLFFQEPIQFQDRCGASCQEEIKKIVSASLATISATPQTVVKTGATTTKETKTAYIPLAGPITTTSTGWVDATGTDVYLDLINDYGKSAQVYWEGFLKVAHDNGQAFARLYDVTHGISVNGSEISLANTSVSTQVSSGNLSLWQGRNLYRVQIKSLNSFEITFGSGRIKIVY